MDRALEGRVAIVTGASRGIGAAIADRFAEEGARVAAAARTVEPVERYEGSLQETVERITKAGGEAVPVQCDLSKPEDRQRLVSETVDRLGPVDILVNNAAVTFFQPFPDFSEKRFRLMFEVQVRAPYELAQIYLNPDCGFGTFSSRPMNTPDIAEAKLRAMSSAAATLRNRYS